MWVKSYYNMSDLQIAYANDCSIFIEYKRAPDPHLLYLHKQVQG